jgi:hypothetical protein
MNAIEFTDDICKWNIYTIIKYIKLHYVQFLLLILVFIIIYVVDHISYINSTIFTIPSPNPFLSTPASKNTIHIKIKNPKKLKK